MGTPRAGDEKDCEKCGGVSLFETNHIRRGPPFQVGDHVPPPAQSEGPGWDCTVCGHFEPLARPRQPVVVIPLRCGSCRQEMEIECEHVPGLFRHEYRIDCPYCDALNHPLLPGQPVYVFRSGEREPED